MKRIDPRAAGALALMVSLAACVAPPVAPTIPVAPGPGKSSRRSTPIRLVASNTPTKRPRGTPTRPTTKPSAARSSARRWAPVSAPRSAAAGVRRSAPPRARLLARWPAPAVRPMRRCPCSSNTTSSTANAWRPAATRCRGSPRRRARRHIRVSRAMRRRRHPTAPIDRYRNGDRAGAGSAQRGAVFLLSVR